MNGRTLLQYLLMLGMLVGASCGSDKKSPKDERKASHILSTDKFSKEDFSNELESILSPVDTTDSLYRKRLLHTVPEGLYVTYLQNDFLPLWISGEGKTSAAEALLNDLDSLRWDGINPERYGVGDLRNRMKAVKLSELSTIIAFDTACTASYLHASRDLLLGMLTPRTADSLWFHANDSNWKAPQILAAQLGQQNQYPSLDSFRSKVITYGLLQNEYRRYMSLAANPDFQSAKTSLQDSSITLSDSVLHLIIDREVIAGNAPDSLEGKARTVASFQQFYGLRPTGKLDSVTKRMLARSPDSVAKLIRANLERLRWLPRTFENRYVVVNIPLMELFYRDEGRNDYHMRVVVGKPSRQTPVLNANLANIVFNPTWSVPPTILKKDVLPGLMSSGGSYLARKGLHPLDRNGNPVPASRITAKNYRNFIYRQPAGPRNALGDVKFNMPNRWDIYLHDTPHREDFPKRYRALSSGCVRVQEPREFAEFILSTLEGRENFTSGRIDSLIDKRKTRYEVLKTKIPVHLVYLTAFEDESGNLRFLEDIYRRDKKLLAKLP